MSRTNIKVKISWVSIDKDGIDEANIKANKKTVIGDIRNTNNNANSENNITN